jgi:O-antigen/teichoic acid export membrane protein
MTGLEQKSNPELTQKTLKGVFWSYLSFAGGMALSSVTTIVLARLLLPEQFGVVGYCLVAIQYLDILNSAGIDTALIARRENAEEAANAAFIANILLGVICYGLTWVLAPSVAVFFKSPQIVPLLRVLGLSLPLSGLGMVPGTLLQRSLNFRKILIAELGRNFTKGAISIILAVLGFGVWSLVWGQILGILTGTILCWLLASWKPTWRFHAEATRSILFIGFHIIILEIAGALRSNVDYLLVGRILGAAALGYYTMSYRIPELLIRSLNNVVGDVSLPTLAMIQVEPERLRTFYFGYLRYISMFVLPLGTGLAFTARLFIPIFLSDTWNPAIIPTALISLAIGISALGYVPGVLYKAIGRPDVLNRLALTKIPIAVLILWYSTRWNIAGVALGQIAIGLISVSMDTLIVNFILHYTIRELLKAVTPTFLSTIVMALPLFIVDKVHLFSDVTQLVLMILFGVLTYFGMLWLISRETLLLGTEAVRKAFLKKTAGTVSLEVASND